MRKPSWIWGACLVLAACHANPPIARLSVANGTAAAGGAAALAHDGGIVFAQSLGGIADAAKRQRAADLTTALGAALRAERTLRDAELLASGHGPMAYALLDTGTPEATSSPDGGDGGDRPSPSISPVPSPSASDTPAPDETQLAQTAETGWQQLSPPARQQAQTTLASAQAQLSAALQSELTRETPLFQPASPPPAQATVSGGHDLASAFAIDDGQGKRTIQVVRQFDAAGTLVQTVSSLQGAAQGIAVQGTVVRTLQANGEAQLSGNFTLSYGSQQAQEQWTRTVTSNGDVQGQGLLSLADGSRVPLTISGQESGTLTLQATDASAGLQIALSAGVASAQADVAIQAGPLGAANLKLSATDDP